MGSSWGEVVGGRVRVTLTKGPSGRAVVSPARLLEVEGLASMLEV